MGGRRYDFIEMGNPPPPIEVGAALLFRRGRVLIAQRLPHGHLPGKWEFPGGKREPGESIQECIRRELREELGIDVNVHEHVATADHNYPDIRVHIDFFRCSWIGGNPISLGCADFAWISRQEIARYSFPAADAQLLRRLSLLDELWEAS